MTVHDKLRTYEYFGVDFQTVREGATEAQGSCWFCEHETPRFHVNLETQQYNCKHCGESGNLFTFLKAIHEYYLEHTTKEQYKDLADSRYGIPWKMLEDYEFAYYDYYSEPRWLIPVRNSRSALQGFRIYVPGVRVENPPGQPLHLWRVNQLKATGPIVLCEGEWDAMSAERLRRKASRNASVLAVPGANILKQDWFSKFANRDVLLWYDNDGPGREGAQAAARKLQGHARTVRILEWPTSTPDDWDIRDQVHNILDKQKSDAKEAWDDLVKCCEAPINSPVAGESLVYDSDLDDLPKRDKFKQIVKDFKDQDYHFGKSQEDALAITFATMLSIQLPGDPIWMFIVGPPGSGKTLMLESHMRNPYGVFKSSITPKSLISGFRSEEGDPSLIPQLTGKVLILKDYTEIASKSRDEQEEIYGILRGAYDGHCEKTFGNGLTRSYPDCHFAMLAGVTDVIHGDDRASLGERFLKYQLIHGQGYDPTHHIQQAILGMANQHEREKFIRGVCAAFGHKDLEKLKVPKPLKWVINRVVALSQIIAYLRASVPRSRGGEVAYRAAPEVGTRLAKQLIKLGQCLSIVYGKPGIDKDCYRLMEKVAFDTAIGWNLDIFMELAKHSPEPILKEALDQKAKLPATTSARRLEAMTTLGIIERKRLKAEARGLQQAGQPAFGYTLTKPLQKLWKAAKVGDH